ncbi:MAG: PBP1A family penicillin-binding protein [Thermodesulfobacteriota bacterium]|nr:PBP1A family penicillin-binding protein [Thermodesulfobacteriota bacterium]
MPENNKRHALLVIIVAAAGVFAGTALGLFFAIAHDLPQIRHLETFSPSAVSRVYSADDTLLAELYAEKRTPVPYRNIPRPIIEALIATEDSRFYEHSGVDFKGVLRALVRDIMALGFVEGGSTLTQQLAKTLFLTNEKNLIRKIKEAFLTFQLERRYTKKEILEFYLNQVYFGSGAYGINAAAQTFFNKHPADLTLSECALIAGMPKSPSRYSPLVNKELARWRRDTVLRQMHKHGIISKAEYETAVQSSINLNPGKRKLREAPYFVEYVRQILEQTIGEARLFRGGLSIHTTLDSTLQRAASDAVETGLAALEDRMIRKGLNHDPQAALVALNVDTGGILAMVGGRDFQSSPFNRATSARRQPGSAFKPLVYAYALDHGFTQATTILNTPVVFPGGRKDRTWEPKNFSKTYTSEMTLRKALVHSKNIPAARLINKLGPASVARFAAELGISSPLSPYLSLALGTSEVTLMELTSAYSIFPRLGRHIKPYGITRVMDRNGRILWQAKPGETIVMPAANAAIITDMLQGVIREGTGQRANDIQCPVAGKTGTTDSFKDALFLGFSRKIATGVWTGTDDYTTLGKWETGAKAALPIWEQFMKTAHEHVPCPGFDIPDGLVRVRMDPVTGKRVESLDHGVAALFKKGTEPE